MSHAMACDMARASQTISTGCVASASKARVVGGIRGVSRNVRSQSLHAKYRSQYAGKALSVLKHQSRAEARSANSVTTHAVVADVTTTSAPPRVRHTKGKRVVITGLGVVSPLGNDADEFYNNLLEGKSGISAIENFDAKELTTHFAGEVKELDCSGYVTPKMERRLDPYIKYTLVAAKKGLEYAGLDDEAVNKLDKFRCGCLIGSAMGGMGTFATACEVLQEKGPKKMNPFCIPFAITNMASAMLAMDLGFMGPNYSCASACASGNHCIMNAMQHIQRGECDLMLAGASDAAIIPMGMAGFQAAKALSRRNDAPQAASRPWDQNRDGFVMGEGCGVLVLEELEHAKARGATIYAEVLGGSYTCDAHHMTEPNPSGEGVAHCINLALADAGVYPEEVNYVNAHATSTPAGDLAEYRAINKAVNAAGDHPFKMNSTKSLIGHLLGAAGAVEAVAVVKAIATGWLHPNRNLVDPEPEVNLSQLVGGEKEEMKIKVALSNSFGFGGHNSCIVFAPYEE
uniref:3-oxoacyl-[acyl-carrier-protein] synthase I, chloroplastic n=1 Tax=Pyramimonas obovata TaxID=1411642 RepID=A0A7S0QND6_9CHLO|mmetsp:Transcript_12392/g.26066  ORF Transcript_12392/g.26066 Transcript_12392/m.26066 type:complete len:515 (+) Transcript_12392:246-1790(+)|eukprot:CAMPEP_0118932182 /NCGR_PEP_ID=MMETSP1169-20130426/9399_1 /TAXON_ID=36882 /ORGANISM="Pyramimonas obovata, Strain CCMP722" /LENGTH=514 /DNA_ID=CAMNT_0006874799 /DNA_START=240 /DNA_END=1784 /DNA_ORIENTATION=+